MALTYSAISTVNLSSSQSSIDFNNIPSIYSDLRLHLSLRGSGYNATDSYLRFNGSSAANYSSRYVWKDGNSNPATGGSSSGVGAMFIGYGTGTNIAANIFATMNIYIAEYSSTSNIKTCTIENATESINNDQWLFMASGSWALTSAITSISIVPGSSGTWAANSTATLYGIKKA